MAFDVPLGIVKSTHLAERRLTGSFVAVNGGNPVSWKGNCISSIARTAEGLWTITMKSKFKNSYTVISRLASFASTTAIDGLVVFGDIDLSAGTIKLGGFKAGVADDLAETGNTISFEVVIESNQIKDGSVP
jgi:hypothetical protein